jgi:hypothetical protein
MNNDKIASHITMHLETFLHSPEDVVGVKDFNGIKRTVLRLLHQYYPETATDNLHQLNDNKPVKKEDK